MAQQRKTTGMTHRCSKEDKIDAMEKKINDLDEVVLKGTNGDSLVVMAKQTMRDVKHVKDSMIGMKKSIGELKSFKTETETKDDLTREMRKNRQWSMGTIVVIVLGILSVIVTLIAM
jgi:hypothetical protein